MTYTKTTPRGISNGKLYYCELYLNKSKEGDSCMVSESMGSCAAAVVWAANERRAEVSHTLGRVEGANGKYPQVLVRRQSGQNSPQ